MELPLDIAIPVLAFVLAISSKQALSGMPIICDCLPGNAIRRTLLDSEAQLRIFSISAFARREPDSSF
jgi:hypothetical protein